MPLQTLQRTAGYAGLAKDALQLRQAQTEFVRQRAEAHLSQRMGKLRGLPQKLGQMLSFSAQHEEDELGGSLSSLQESAEPLPWSTVEQILSDAWQCDPQAILAEVDEQGRAASLGQVHRALLRDGAEVAIKVQYPGIRQAVQTDLKALGWLSMPMGGLRRGFDLEGYRQIISDDLEQELDYHSELQRQDTMANLWRQNPAIIVPGIWHDLCRENVLVSDWQDGEHWSSVSRDWSVDKRRKVAKTLLDFFLEGLFQHGLMQADWHPGNVRFCDTADGVQILLYDFGCMAQPSRRQRLLLARLIAATIDGSESPYPLLLELGFNAEYLLPLEKKLPALCKVLFEPFCTNGPYDPADWKLGERVANVLGDDRWNFRIAGSPDLLLLMRAFHGLIFYLRGLATPVNWRAAFTRVVDPLRKDLLGLRVTSGEKFSGFDTVSQHMRIRVSEGETVKVQLSQHAANIERLHELLDIDLQRRIKAASIELDEIVTDVRQRGYAPGPVFELMEGSKKVEVWLE